MDAFSYLSVLLSVILGLAIQQVLQGYRSLVLARRQVRIYWPSIAWSVVILAMVAQHWWASFGLSQRADWSFADFAVTIVNTALIYMLAALVLPDFPPDQPIDLKDHYFRERQMFLGIGVATIGWSMVREYVLEGRLPLPVNLVFHIVFLTMGVTALLTRREWVHKLFAAAMVAIFSFYIAMLFARLEV